MPRLRTATSKTHTPHFARHTQASLLKTRTPTKLKKSSALMNQADELKKLQGGGILKLNGIYRRRNNVVKQSRGMQMLISVLKQQRERRTNIFLPDNELPGTTSQLESSLISFQSDLIKDVSHDIKKCLDSPVKLVILSEKLNKSLARVIDESESLRAEDLHASPQDETNCTERDDKEDAHSSGDRTIVDVVCKRRLDSNDEEEPTELCCEAEDLRRTAESGENANDSPNKDCSEIQTQIHSQVVNIATNCKRTRKAWRKATIRYEHANVDHAYACRTDLQGSKSASFTRHVGNSRDNQSANDKPAVSGDATRKRGALQKNLTFNQRTWRPSGAPKTWTTESATSLQPTSQKSSQSTKKSTASKKGKDSSTVHVDVSTSTSISANQSKMLMKENRDPRANRMTKICEHDVAVAKQRQRPQCGGTLPKKRRSRTWIYSKASDKCDDTNPTLAKSKSRHCQTGYSNDLSNIGQHRSESTVIYSKSRTLEVIHTLKKIIDKKDEDAEENDDFEHEKNEIQTSSNNDACMLHNNEPQIFTRDVNLDKANRPSQRSISTQTELKNEEERDMKEILKLTRIVATQTSPRNKSTVEIGCNTSNVICIDVGVSCDLIGPINLKTEVDPTIEDKSTSDVPIHMTPSSVKHIGINVENEDAKEKKKLSLSGCKKTLEMSLKSVNYDGVEITTNVTNDTGEAEQITYEEACEISLKLSENSDDKINDIDENQESTTYSNNPNVNNTSVNLFASSFEEVMEHEEDDVQYENTATSELKVEDIPNDVIATFELAAERGRNLHQAFIIYRENLMSKESEKRNEENTVEDYETSESYNEHNCFEKRASFMSRENEKKIKSECDAIYHLANYVEDFSTCSSRGSISDQIYGSEFSRSSEGDHFGIEREENAVLSGNGQAIERSTLNQHSDLDVKLMQLLVRRSQEDYALEVLQSESNDESFVTERMRNVEALALPATIKSPSLISRENLLPLVYCVICTVVFWYLQFLFRCDSTK